MNHSFTPVIALLSLKGGVGKTTLAMHLTMCLNNRCPCTAIDYDDEKSALRWAQHQNLPFTVLAGERDRLAQQVRHQQQNGLAVVIDTPPNNRELLTRAAMIATHIVVPISPTGMDIDRMMPPLELLRDVEATRGALDVAIVLNRWDGRKRLAREALTALQGFPVLESRIRGLTRYEEAFGTMPSHLEEYQAVLKELLHEPTTIT